MMIPVEAKLAKSFVMLDSITSRSTTMEGVSRLSNLSPTAGAYIVETNDIKNNMQNILVSHRRRL